MHLLGVSLFIQDPEQRVVEGDFGDSSELISCLRANLSQPLNRDALFFLVQADSNTAMNFIDFEAAGLSIIVPGDFSGEFIACVSFLIIGDNLFEGNETILFEVLPQVAVDSVMFPGNIRVDILDDDGMYCVCIHMQGCI